MFKRIYALDYNTFVTKPSPSYIELKGDICKRKVDNEC